MVVSRVRLVQTLQHHSEQSRDNEEPGLDHTDSLLREEDSTRRLDLVTRLCALSASPSADGETSRPPLNIVIMVFGSRGDIQPYLKIGKLLKEDHGHRVRIATHSAFKRSIEQDSGLEFFSVGGNPVEIAAYMSKNPGIIPSMDTIRRGEIGRRRDAMFEMFQGFWRACIDETDDEPITVNVKTMEGKRPFIADAIIASPASFAHVHCAERLGIPVHLMHTFPGSPTQQFPYPFLSTSMSNLSIGRINVMSYILVAMVLWQGFGDLVNHFRIETLGLEPVSTLWAPLWEPGQLFRQELPYTYICSRSLIPKPADWGPNIDIAGYVFLDRPSSFEPPQALAHFLNAGGPPIYIGFGSVIVDDPEKLTSLIFEAVEKAGVRALVSKGWGGLGNEGNTPDHIYMLEDTPHDWLFPRVSALVHHGGAGTTAIGLKCGKPTVIVPFCSDQAFWGAMVAKAGAGAERAIPYKELSADALAEGIKQCLTLEAKEAADRIAKSIAEEGDGAKNVVELFHRHLPLRGNQSMRCSILHDRVAVWRLKGSNLKLSALAAEFLIEQKEIQWKDLTLCHHYDWNDLEGPGEPFTGAAAALANSAVSIAKGIGGIPIKWAKSIRRHQKSKQRQKARTKSHAQLKTSQTEGLQFNDHVNKNQGAREEIAAELAQDIAKDLGRGLMEMAEALAKAPMDLSLAVAQGFHNAPRLYGDDTVRKPLPVSGFRSSLRAARSELIFGIYDGVTGLILQPYRGARRKGALGFVQGVGKGVAGFVLKNLAAITGLFGYTLKGVYKELVNDRQPTAFIYKARMIQGVNDAQTLDEEAKQREMSKVNAAWRIISDIRKEDEAQMQEILKGRLATLKDKIKMSDSLAEGASLPTKVIFTAFAIFFGIYILAKQK